MSFSDKADDLTNQAKHAAGDVADTVKSGGGVIAALSKAGVRSEYAYAAALVSIGLSYASYFVSRGKKGDDKAQSDRWGIFIGHWAPTLFGLGTALRLEEES